MKKTVAIIGGGNGAQAMAGYFGMHEDYEVRLFDYFQKTVDALNAKGSIQLVGAVEGVGKLAFATTDMHKAVDGADLVMVVAPAIYHDKIARDMAPFVRKDTVIFLSPSSVFGAFAFKKALEDCGNQADVVIGESNSLLFAARLVENGKVNIGGKKDVLMVAAFPADKGHVMYDIIAPVMDGIKAYDTVLATSFDNTNCMVHPLPTMLNCNWSESGAKYKYYQEGIGKICGDYIEAIDRERVEIGKKLGLELGSDLFDIYMEYEDQYGATGPDVTTVLKSVSAYDQIYASNDVRIRYIYEDIPTGMVPFVAVGRLLGMPVAKMQLVIDLCEQMLGEDFTHCESARSLDKLGLAGMNAEQIVNYARTGKKASNLTM